MIKSYFSAWKRSFDFSGKTSRSEFWKFNIIDFLICFIPSCLIAPFNMLAGREYVSSRMQISGFSIPGSPDFAPIGPGYCETSFQVIKEFAPFFHLFDENACLVFHIALFSSFIPLIYIFSGIFPRIAIRIRRLRDIGKPWQNIFLWLIPFVGLVLEFVWFTRPRKREKITFSE
tara:strand:- start:78 stop:599 length:522 start_codon:yes stop_codon:yes gene_type:complete